MSLALALFIAVNVGIFIGYMTIARYIMPNLNVQYRSTKYGGAVFFATCAATHAELAIHAWTDTPITRDDLTSWHMMLVHIPQFIAVWVFTYGLAKEVRISNAGRLQLSKLQNVLRNTVSEIEGMKSRVTEDDTRLLEEALISVRSVERNIAEIEANKHID